MIIVFTTTLLSASGGTPHFGGPLTALVIWLAFTAGTDLYDLNVITQNRRGWLAAVGGGLSAVSLLFVSSPQSTILVQYCIATALILFIWQHAFVFAYRSLGLRHRMVVVGTDQSAHSLAEFIASREKAQAAGYEFVGFVTEDDSAPSVAPRDYPTLGSSAELSNIVDREQIDVIVLSVSNATRLSPSTFSSLIAAREKGIEIVSMPRVYELLTGTIAIEHVGPGWGLFFPMEDCNPRIGHDIASRAVDIIVGAIGSAFCLLVTPAVAIGNAFGNPGPLFYSQIRLGKGGRPYRIYKFRSMVTDAEKNGPAWSQVGDPRITKVGLLYRKTRIDELPQFWNVLRGDMAFVGPRPERPEFVDILEEKIPFYRARTAVKPGITGWAQVMYRYGASESDSLVKLRYDLYYIKNRSIFLDIKIALKTIATVILARGQ